MLGFFKKKPNLRKLDYFKSIHRVDVTYVADLNGVKIDDPISLRELEDMVELTSLCVSAIIPQKLTSYVGLEISDPFEVGYVFGFLDVTKVNVWGVKEFSKSFFHSGYSMYVAPFPEKNDKERISRIEGGCDALFAAFFYLQSEDASFLQGVSAGKDDARAWWKEKSIPRKLVQHFRELSQ